MPLCSCTSIQRRCIPIQDTSHVDDKWWQNIYFFLLKKFIWSIGAWDWKLNIHVCTHILTSPSTREKINKIYHIHHEFHFFSVMLKLIYFVFVSLIIPPFYYYFLYLKGSWINLRLYCGLCLQSVHLQEGKPEKGGERRSAAKIWVLSAAAFATAGGAHNTQGESPSTTSQKRS